MQTSDANDAHSLKTLYENGEKRSAGKIKNDPKFPRTKEDLRPLLTSDSMEVRKIGIELVKDLARKK